MSARRVLRLNSLLKEVISEVLRKDLHHVIDSGDLLTITSVEITADLSYAKVFISLIGDMKAKERMVFDLNRISGQIAHIAMKKVRMRLFPKLSFFLDEGLEKQMRICDVLAEVLPEGKKPQS
jgi:ribosome-binding factor A